MTDESERAWRLAIPVRLLEPSFPTDSLFSADLHTGCGSDCDRAYLILIPPDAEPAAQ